MIEQERILLLRPGHYILPDDLMFEGLALSQGKETVRIRFSRERGITLEIPLSAESLAALVQVMSSLHGSLPSELPAALADLRQKVGFLDD